MKILQENIASAYLLEAAKYYYSYSPFKEDQTILNARAYAFALSVNFDKNSFYQLNTNSLFEAFRFTESLKQHIFSIYYFNSLLNELKLGYENLIQDIKSKTNKINDDLIYLKKVTLQNALARQYLYSKSSIINNFKDSGIQNYSTFKDFKTKTMLSRSDMIKSKDRFLHLDESESSLIIPNEINLVYEATRFTEIIYQNDLMNLLYDSEPFKFVIFYQTKDTQGFEILKTEGQICLMFEFDSPQDINKIRIDSASSSPFYIKENALLYYNDDLKQYIPALFKQSDLNENIDLYLLDKINTRKIKLTLNQTKWIEERTYNDLNGKVFDYSIDRVQFFYTNYKAFGVFRSNELIPINTPLSLEYNCDYLLEEQDCYLEYYLEYLLYGESDFDSFNYVKQEENVLIKQTPRLKGVYPFPSEKNIQRELLGFNSYKAKLLFVPIESVNTLKVFMKKQGDSQVRELEIGIDYNISRDSGETFVNSFSTSSSRDFIAGSYQIQLIVNQFDEVLDYIKSEFYVEYELMPVFYLNEEKTLIWFNNKVLFNDKLQESVGYVRPILIFRTKDYQFDSTSIISSIKIVCEEKELNKDSYIELIDFVEYISQGDGNVVI